NTAFRARPAQRGHEDRALAGGVRREELHPVAVVEREPGGAESLRVGGEVGAAASQPRLEIRQTIAAIAEPTRERIEPGEPVDDRRRVSAERLLQTEIRRPILKLAGRPRLGRGR